MNRPSLPFAFAAAGLVVLGVALMLPWYRAYTTTGNLAPPGQPEIYDRTETILRPYDVESTDPPRAGETEAAQLLGVLLTVALAATGLLLILDFFFEASEAWRRPLLALAFVGIAFAAGVIAWAAARFGDVTGSPAFVGHANRGEDYATGNPLAGWFVTFAALPPLITYFALRYASGSMVWTRPARA